MDLLEMPPEQALRELEVMFESQPDLSNDDIRALKAGKPDAAAVRSFIHELFDPLPDDEIVDGQLRAVAKGPFGAAAYRELDLLADELQQVDRQLAALEARRIDVLARGDRWAERAAETHLQVSGNAAERRQMAQDTVVLELSCATRVPRATLSGQLATAVELDGLPVTLAALRAGRMSVRHARVIADTCIAVPREAAIALERQLAAVAESTSPSLLRRKARALRERMHPESIQQRVRIARQERRVAFEAADDGMAWLHLFAPAPECLRVYETVTEVATARQCSNENRTLPQLRADALVDFVLGPRHGQTADRDEIVERARRAAQPRIFVTVPVLSLLGLSDEPATLDGYGPIDPETARQLTAEAPGLSRLLTHPISSAVLDVDRNSYRVPADLKRWLQVRDSTCRAPFSGVAAARCDLDHTQAWEHEGRTRHDNLAHLSRGWHRAKHRLGWRLRQGAGGILTWTSPTGRTYTTQPAVPIGFPRAP